MNCLAASLQIAGKVITHEISSSLKPLILLHRTLTKDSLRKLIDNAMIRDADISFPSSLDFRFSG
jgi:hypothetical protein